MDAKIAEVLGNKLYLDSAHEIEAPAQLISTTQTYYWTNDDGVVGQNAVYKLSVTIGTKNIVDTLQVA